MPHSERVMRAEAELKMALAEEEGWSTEKRIRAGVEKRDPGYGLNETAGGLAAVERPQFNVEHLFEYHTPSFADLPRFQAIRRTAKFLAETILGNTPPGDDQAAAIRQLRECVMTANAAIALGGRT